MTLRLTDGAAEHLAGRPLVVRALTAQRLLRRLRPVPVAEIGPPTDAASFTVMHLGGIEVHVDPRLGPVDGLVVDVDGLWRWRRLRVECERPHDENR